MNDITEIERRMAEIEGDLEQTRIWFDTAKPTVKIAINNLRYVLIKQYNLLHQAKRGIR